MIAKVIWLALVAGLAIAGATSRFWWPSKQPDNFVEEKIEEYIEHETHFHLDLSPDTPDPDDDYQARK